MTKRKIPVVKTKEDDPVKDQMQKRRKKGLGVHQNKAAEEDEQYDPVEKQLQKRKKKGQDVHQNKVVEKDEQDDLAKGQDQYFQLGLAREPSTDKSDSKQKMTESALEKDFFKMDAPHGLVKRVMYKKYIQAFVAITQRADFKTIVIDGFSGEGRYGKSWPDVIEKYGSPLIALMVSLNFLYKRSHNNEEKNWNMKIDDKIEQYDGDSKLEEKEETNACNKKINLYFVEANKAFYNVLVTNTLKMLHIFFEGNTSMFVKRRYRKYILVECTDANFSLECRLYNMKFEDFSPPTDEKNTRWLTFVDPFGYTHNPMETMKRYIGEHKEVLVNFMSSYVNRFVSRNAEGVADLYGIQDVARLFAIESGDVTNDDVIVDFVKYVIRNSCEPEKPTNDVQKCVVNYEKMLRRKAGTEFSVTFEMRGKNNAIIYHMVFITNHPKGLKEMKESMNRCTQYEGALKMSDYYINVKGAILNFENKQDAETVAQAIFNEFQGKRNVNINKIETFVSMDTPYVFRKKPLEIMAIETPNPRIENVVDGSDKAPKRRGTFSDRSAWFITFRPK